MHPNLPLLFAFIGASLAACTAPDPQAVSHTARFPDYPDVLFEAFEQACTGPAQTFVRPRANARECREYLSPEQTAFAILQYDGTTEDLPQLVNLIASHPDGKDFLVTIQSYLNVPQKTGGAVHVVFPSTGYSARLTSLLRMAGGAPE